MITVTNRTIPLSRTRPAKKKNPPTPTAPPTTPVAPVTTAKPFIDPDLLADINEARGKEINIQLCTVQYK